MFWAADKSSVAGRPIDMETYRADHDQTRHHRKCRLVIRRLLTDILPTLLLLLAMALGMSMVARYAESSHSKTIFANNTFQQYFD